MAKIQFAKGHNQAGSLAALSFHCSYAGVFYPEQRYDMDGVVGDAGKGYTDLKYLLLWASYTTLLSELGLTSVRSALGTIRLELYTGVGFANYNCTVVKPELSDGGVWGMAYRPIVIRVKDLVAI